MIMNQFDAEMTPHDFLIFGTGSLTDWRQALISNGPDSSLIT